MAARPVFLVTKIKNVRRVSPANRYTGAKDRIDCWRVSFLHGYFAGVEMEYFFPDEASADEFSEWQIYNPAQILAVTDPTEPFMVQDIQQDWWYGKVNQYSVHLRRPRRRAPRGASP